MGCLAQELGEELAGEAHAARAGDGLHARDAARLEGLGVLAVRELQRQVHEVLHAGDAGVLLVLAGGHDALLGLLHGRQHVRLAVVVTVGADAKRDLARVRVLRTTKQQSVSKCMRINKGSLIEVAPC